MSEDHTAMTEDERYAFAYRMFTEACPDCFYLDDFGKLAMTPEGIDTAAQLTNLIWDDGLVPLDTREPNEFIRALRRSGVDLPRHAEVVFIWMTLAKKDIRERFAPAIAADHP